jgi:hypothetical protein
MFMYLEEIIYKFNHVSVYVKWIYHESWRSNDCIQSDPRSRILRNWDSF